MKILLVDDEVEILEVVEEMLLLEGFDVKTSSSPIEVINSFSLEDVDCVVTDLRMPELGGKEFICQLRDKNPYLKVIVLSGDCLEKNFVESLALSAVFSKPIDFNLLINKLVEIGGVTA